MKIQFTSSTLTRQLNVSRIIRVLFVALAALATPPVLFAQEQGIITLLPIEVKSVGDGCKPMTIQGQNNKPKCTIVLRFQTNSIPRGAKVNAAHLMMVGGMKATQTISVYVDDISMVFGEITPVATESFPPNKRADWPGGARFRDKINAKPAESFSLIMQTASDGLASEWKNDLTVSGSRPRLTLEYTVEGQRIVQSEGVPATASPTSFLPIPTISAQFGSREVSSIWSFAPVFHNGLVYLIRENKLQALTALGAPPVWSLPLDKPGQHLLLSRSGRLYIVGAGKILVYELQADPKSPATEVTTSGGQPLSPKLVTNLNPSLAPAVGADGSLYFVNGQEVYGQNPDLQELWKVTLTNTTTSRVTVGPTGRFVYLTAKGEGLVAIDAQTGEKVPVKSNNSQSKLADNNNITFHAPVVIEHPDGTEKIYAAANSVGNGVLTDFDNPRTTKPKQRIPGPITADWEPLAGLWSQPLPDLLSPGTITAPSTTKQIYAVSVMNSQGTLTAINWLSGLAQPQAPSFPVAASPDLLNIASNGGVIGVTKDGVVFVWDGNNVKLYIFTPKGSVAALPLAASSGLTVGSRLAFGSDGTLYLADASNAANRTLRAIVPQFTLEKVSSEKIFSPTHLRVDGIVDKNTELTAPGSVFLRDGFTVKQGVTLTIKQPKP